MILRRLLLTGHALWVLPCVLLLSGCNSKPPGPSAEELLRRQQLRESVQNVTAKTLEERIATVRDYLSNGNAAAAQKELRALLISHPEDHRVILLSAKAEALGGDKLAAAATLEAIGSSNVEAEVESLWLAAGWLMEGYHYDEAQKKLERLLELPGDKARVHRQLAMILFSRGRQTEAAEHLHGLASLAQLRDQELLAFNSYGESFLSTSRANPESGAKLDPGALVQAKIFRRDGELQWSRDLVEKLNEAFPESTPIAAFRGRIYADQQDDEKLREWITSVPPGIDREPEYWHALGVWLRRQGRHREAVRCLAEAIRRDETDRFAYLALANSLQLLGETDSAKVAAVRYDLLTEAAGIAREVRKNGLEKQEAEGLDRMAQILDELHRPWEAYSWRHLAMKKRGITASDRAELDAQRESLVEAENVPQRDDSFACGLDLAKWPVPATDEIRGLVSTESNRDTTPAIARTNSQITFADEAAIRDMIHTCELSPDVENESRWIYQTVGGGVGVVDFDLDGWPDLAAAMLNGQPLKMNSSPNRLFRNLGGHFAECTVPSNYLDRGYSQGITIADYNDDGFPDIFDSNIGQNRLFRNNGDGTFQEVAALSGLGGEVWTTSSAIADIDGDGFADIFEIGYCAGNEPYEKECYNKKGISSCMPLKFDAEKDRVWRATGDGTFTNMTESWMNQTSPGHGLGILVGLFDEQPGLDLYVANDMSINQLWCGRMAVPDPAQPPGSGTGDSGFRLIDEAAIRGVGLSGSSLAQASMGMSAADPDGDGDIDFFLTHFSDEHNTYYEQVAPGLWMDRSFQVGLAEPSMKLLGFGTEWVDFDNDGTLELVAVNGHVNNAPFGDISDRMPPQLFQLDAGGRWIELDRKSLGEYFTGQYLGRALATVDVDRDGRLDVAITHLFDPVALLMNKTTGGGDAISLELKSTSTQRDAIGAIVSAVIGGRTVTSQLTAGDGYMCSNQRRIHLGTGNLGEAEQVTVTWPSGRREEFGSLASGAEYLIVEGSGEAFPWKGAK